MKLLDSAVARAIFEHELERVRRWHGCYITGYVVMPEHVHLLLSEPERNRLAVVIQMLKQLTSRRLRMAGWPLFWQVRYYDFPVWSEAKRVEKLRYIHRNPVHRGLVARPEDWPWSSFVHYATGAEGIVEIESEWTAEAGTNGCAGQLGQNPPSRTKRGKGGATLMRTVDLERLGQPPSLRKPRRPGQPRSCWFRRKQSRDSPRTEEEHHLEGKHLKEQCSRRRTGYFTRGWACPSAVGEKSVGGTLWLEWGSCGGLT